MAVGRGKHDWHFLDCFGDDNNSCALTVFVAGERLHVIADSDNFSSESAQATRYHQLRKRLQKHHGRADEDAPKSQSSGIADSGVDVRSDVEINVEKNESEEDGHNDPEYAIAVWMLQPLSSTIEDIVKSNKSKTRSLQEWYKCRTTYHDLSISSDDDKLQATELENSDDMEQRMKNLLPDMWVPKYITQDDNVRFYKAGDLTVLDESEEPIGTPYHPCRVKVNGDEIPYFLKIVDNNQHMATKRELQILNKVRVARLQDKIHIPILEGLVSFDDAKDTPAGRKRIMGFLQTDIAGARPLTHMLDPKIPQKKRERWASDAERLKDTLHENGIIWGDAKADNFMVDEQDELWIIDFGGSYTDGWIDPELKESQEGDDMGTQKTVDALLDPVNNTLDPGEESDQRDGNGDNYNDNDRRPSSRDDTARNHESKKRTASEIDNTSAGEESPRKRSKK